MGTVTSLHGTTPAEVFESGIENVADIAAVAAVVLWNDGRITAGWSSVELSSLSLMVTMLDEKHRQTVVDQLAP